MIYIKQGKETILFSLTKNQGLIKTFRIWEILESDKVPVIVGMALN